MHIRFRGTGVFRPLKARKPARNRAVGLEDYEEGRIPTEAEFDQSGDVGVATTRSHRIRSLEELISYFQIDTQLWEAERVVTNNWEMGAKVTRDKKEIIIVEPLFQIKAWFRRRKAVEKVRQVLDDLIADARARAPRYRKVQYPKRPGEFLCELAIPDLHLGKLVWDKECGESYDIRIAQQLFEEAIESLLSRTRGFDIGRILFVVGNDFFNVDNHLRQTTSGTPQDEDSRWQKSFSEGRRLLVNSIDRLQEVAPVSIVMVSGNHDMERVFTMGEVLDAQYHKCPNVTVDNSPALRKYFSWGRVLLGFTHGDKEKPEGLPLIMATERPLEWAETEHREFHCGHFHKQKQVRFIDVDEFRGVRVRYLSSLTACDAWHTSRGYRAKRAAEAFVWCRETGLVGTFSHIPRS